MKRVQIIVVLIACVILFACGKSEPINTVEQKGDTEQRAYNENMTEKEYMQVSEDVVAFILEMENCIEKMASMYTKYADDLTNLSPSATFDWTQHWDFRELKSNFLPILEEMLQYDDSKCSAEFQLCLDECKSMAFEFKNYFDMVSQERSTQEIYALGMNLFNSLEQGVEQADIYHTEATITYLEANDGDADTIQSLKDHIADKSVKNIAHSSNSGVFTNSYGTATTKCEHNGCNNTIASSGDTNCCVVHSNKCLNCGKYIDEDAVFCMDCIRGEFSRDTSVSGGCKYKYFDGTVCGEKTNNSSTLCDKHFNELKETYDSIFRE